MKLLRNCYKINGIMSFRQEKVSSLLKSVAASFIQKEIPIATGILISVTGVNLSKDLKMASVLVSVFPEKKEKETVKILKRNRSRLREYAKPFLKMKFLPYFEIEIDKGEKRRQRIDEILHK